MPPLPPLPTLPPNPMPPLPAMPNPLNMQICGLPFWVAFAIAVLLVVGRFALQTWISHVLATRRMDRAEARREAFMNGRDAARSSRRTSRNPVNHGKPDDDDDDDPLASAGRRVGRLLHTTRGGKWVSATTATRQLQRRKSASRSAASAPSSTPVSASSASVPASQPAASVATPSVSQSVPAPISSAPVAPASQPSAKPVRVHLEPHELAGLDEASAMDDTD